MVAGAGSMGALGVIRSLGRAGYVVHAVASSPDAIGLHSRFARHKIVHPAGDDPHFPQWAEACIAANEIELIIPGGPVSLGGPAVFKRYAHLFPQSHDPAVLARARKYELFQTILAGRGDEVANLPPLALVDLENFDPLGIDLGGMDLPIFIKLDAAHSRGKGSDAVIRVASRNEALARLGQLRSQYKKAVVQGFVPGCGVGVFLLRWNGTIKARFMHRRLHEMPHTGGASSLRESWWHDRIVADAEAKLALVDWQGVAMVEYRWDSATDRFYLMEMNLRFWGSIHLALYADVDFPKELADCFFGTETSRPQSTATAPSRLGLRCRNTIPFEIGYLASLWRDKDVALSRKLFAIWEMICLTFDFRVKNDLLFPGDRMLFWYRLWRFVRTGQ